MGNFKTLPVHLPDDFTCSVNKEPERWHTGPLKLLDLKSTKSKKTFPKTHKQERNTTLQEKLAEVYLKSHRRNTLMKERNFMKNDFLKELVMKEELNYLILEILPKNKCFYRIDNVRVPTAIEGPVYEDIQNEAISIATFKEILEMMLLYSIDINDFIYDYHIILNIRKYLSRDDKAQPVFSTFILLKPTNMLLMRIAEALEDDENNDPTVPDLKSLRKASKIFCEISGPLYLNTCPLAKDFINFLKEYRYQFDSDTCNQEPEGENTEFKINMSPLIRLMKKLAQDNRDKERVNRPMEAERIIESGESWEKRLKLILAEREFKKPKNFLNLEDVVEIFTVKFAIRSKYKTVPVQRFITVFHHPDGTFKFCTTIRLFVFHMPRYPDAVFMETRNKEVLDRYIYTVILYLDRISACGLQIIYHNLITQHKGVLHTGDKILIKSMNKKPYSMNSCPLKVMPDVRKRFLDACGINEYANQDYFVRQQVLINGCIREVLVKVKKNPYVVDVYLKIEAGKYNRRPEEIDLEASSLFERPEEIDLEAGSLFENGNCRTAFEAHYRFDKFSRYPFRTHGGNGEKIRSEFYPSLSQTYDFCNEDELDGYNLAITDDVRGFLNLCSKEKEMRKN